MIVDEPKDNLVVLGEILQDLRSTLLGEQQFSFRVSRDERHDLTALQRPREGAGPGVFESNVPRSALVVTGVVRREDGLRGLGDRAAQSWKLAGLGEDLDPISHANEGFDGLYVTSYVHRTMCNRAYCVI